jgi:glucose-6-phosphate isomerase
MSIPLSKTKHWSLLQQHAQDLADTSLLNLFNDDKDREKNFHCKAAGLSLDFSKQKISAETLNLLFSLAHEQTLASHFTDLFSGHFVNKTENRRVFHTALRAPADGSSIHHEIQDSLKKMADLVTAIHTQQWRGYSNQPITDVVNIGIGGSYLGPALVCDALHDFCQNTASGAPLNIHFVADIHSRALEKTVAKLNPATTLFLISSKSFTTFETMTNFLRAKNWFAQTDSAAFRQHFVAITANSEKAFEHGFTTDRIIPFWDWVGGRYSVWSAIGLPIALSIGMDNFYAFLKGAHAIDQHVANSAPENNMAMILALLDLWQINCQQIQNHAILAYHDNFSLLTAYLQQLIMESSGKNRDQDNNLIDYQTAPIVWGGQGALGQHAYYQLLHQGTIQSLIDFILVADTEKEVLSSALSQAQVLMEGDTSPSLLPAYLPGNRGSNIIWLENLTPHTLGALLALFEHRTFAGAMLWHINPFDQWGVERGKVVQKQLQQKFAITNS